MSLNLDARQGKALSNLYSTILTLFLLQIAVAPFLTDNSLWVANNLQMLIVVCQIVYVYFLGLSLNFIGVILRIFARMCFVVVVFGLVSLPLLAFIAYPMHTLMLNFSMIVEDSELNIFRSLYNGTLTLFEFVFGAVVFIRPFTEDSFYTYAITLFMILFSFFGNIMLANMLVAFLANQFEIITKNAKYDTLSMQHGLTRVLRPTNLDSVYALPYFFSLFAVPVYLYMFTNKQSRPSLNKHLRRLIHLFPVYTPTIIYYSTVLLLLAIKQYVGIALRLLGGIKDSAVNIIFFFVWLVVGLPFQIKLFFEDASLVSGMMLDFRDAEDRDLYKIYID